MFSLSNALCRLGVGWLAIAACLSVAKASLIPETSPLEVRAAAGDRLVFCHFMVRCQLHIAISAHTGLNLYL
jgi:hypothetical protein